MTLKQNCLAFHPEHTLAIEGQIRFIEPDFEDDQRDAQGERLLRRYV